MTNWPWGTGPAPAHTCHGCNRRIGKTAMHYIFDGNLLLCGRCAVLDNSSVTLHGQNYPNCSDKWHDIWDHLDSTADRGAAWYVLNTPKEQRHHQKAEARRGQS